MDASKKARLEVSWPVAVNAAGSIDPAATCGPTALIELIVEKHGGVETGAGTDFVNGRRDASYEVPAGSIDAVKDDIRKIAPDGCVMVEYPVREA